MMTGEHSTMHNTETYAALWPSPAETPEATPLLDEMLATLEGMEGKLKIYRTLFDAENTPAAQPVPEGYSGSLLDELAEIERQEEAQCGFVLQRARALAWQAVCSTPAHSACAEMCLNWIKHAHTWALRRQHDHLAASLAELEDCLQLGLPKLKA